MERRVTDHFMETRIHRAATTEVGPGSSSGRLLFYDWLAPDAAQVAGRECDQPIVVLETVSTDSCQDFSLVYSTSYSPSSSCFYPAHSLSSSASLTFFSQAATIACSSAAYSRNIYCTVPYIYRSDTFTGIFYLWFWLNRTPTSPFPSS